MGQKDIESLYFLSANVMTKRDYSGTRIKNQKTPIKIDKHAWGVSPVEVKFSTYSW
jgi:hypothetical protein